MSTLAERINVLRRARENALSGREQNIIDDMLRELHSQAAIEAEYINERPIVVATNLVGHHDRDAIMLHACMRIMVEFVEEECGGVAGLRAWNIDIAQFDNTAEQIKKQEELIRIYEWWTIDRPKAWDGASFGSVDALEEVDTNMLSRLVAIRESLWT